jgi:hypothetical protein
VRLCHGFRSVLLVKLLYECHLYTSSILRALVNNKEILETVCVSPASPLELMLATTEVNN